jgi:hypothetical protein
VVKEAKALERGFAARGGIALRELPKAREYVAALEKVRGAMRKNKPTARATPIIAFIVMNNE